MSINIDIEEYNQFIIGESRRADAIDYIESKKKAGRFVDDEVLLMILKGDWEEKEEPLSEALEVLSRRPNDDRN